jgi:uncharacterized protein DUF6915
MKPYLHSKLSVKKFGGKPEDYQEIHDFIDSTKAHIADVRHRALLHSSWGIFMVEKIFGTNITNSDNKLVSTRDIAEEHILEDLGRIPSVQDYLGNMTIQPWMGGKVKRRRNRTIKAQANVQRTPRGNMHGRYLD